MESEILQELELIRGYVFVMMCAVILWIIFKVLESAQNVFTGFKKAWDTNFNNRMSNFQDSGEYEKIIAECKEKLEKYPNHNDAVWFLAIAYFYTEQFENSKLNFEKVIYLVPSWEESANAYLEKLKKC